MTGVPLWGSTAPRPTAALLPSRPSCLDYTHPTVTATLARSRLQEEVQGDPDLKFPLSVKPLTSDGSGGSSQASVVQDAATLADRVSFIHERFGQGAIAEEFVDGRELYVSLMGNDDGLEILPI